MPNDVIEQTWKNARDSLKHAFDHYFELEMGSENKWHHHKWIIVSVHHAASCVSLMWLTEADPSHALFANGDFPHLKDSAKALMRSGRLSVPESLLVEMFTRLNEIRNKFMHRIAPENIDDASIAFAATSVIGMLHAVAHRQGKDFYELFDEFPENRKAVTEVIRANRLDEYGQLIGKLVQDQHPGRYLEDCPNCGVGAVLDGHCEACFEDIKEVTCRQCEEEFLTISGFPFPQHCPQCGVAIND